MYVWRLAWTREPGSRMKIIKAIQKLSIGVMTHFEHEVASLESSWRGAQWCWKHSIPAILNDAGGSWPQRFYLLQLQSAELVLFEHQIGFASAGHETFVRFAWGLGGVLCWQKKRSYKSWVLDERVRVAKKCRAICTRMGMIRAGNLPRGARKIVPWAML